MGCGEQVQQGATGDHDQHALVFSSELKLR
jgi:hypothetical protein